MLIDIFESDVFCGSLECCTKIVVYDKTIFHLGPCIFLQSKLLKNVFIYVCYDEWKKIPSKEVLYGIYIEWNCIAYSRCIIIRGFACP